MGKKKIYKEKKKKKHVEEEYDIFSRTYSSVKLNL